MTLFKRSKNKIQNPYTIKDFYIYYRDKIEKNSPYDIDERLYQQIVYYYFKRMIDLLLVEGECIKLPVRLGNMFISKKKMKMSRLTSGSIDWYNTKKYGKHIYHTNDHSNQYKYYFTWKKVGASIVNIRKYRFVATRDNKRRLGHIILNKLRDYIEI